MSAANGVEGSSGASGGFSDAVALKPSVAEVVSLMCRALRRDRAGNARPYVHLLVAVACSLRKALRASAYMVTLAGFG